MGRSADRQGHAESHAVGRGGRHAAPLHRQPGAHAPDAVCNHRGHQRARCQNSITRRPRRCRRPCGRPRVARLAVQLRRRCADRAVPALQGRRLDRGRRRFRLRRGGADSDDGAEDRRQQARHHSEQPDHGLDHHKLLSERNAPHRPGHRGQLQR